MSETLHPACPVEGVPTYAADFYADDFILDPYPRYAEMRALGPVVFLPALRNFAVTRYREAKTVLHDHHVFSSASGVANDDLGCQFLQTNTLISDPPLHDEMRRILNGPLVPGALDEIQPRIQAEAELLIDRLVRQGEFDVMTDLAPHLPQTIVTDLVGLPTDGRENMLEWAAASFNIIGIQNDRGRAALEVVKEMREWVRTRATPDRLKPGSWTARIYSLFEQGLIPDWMASSLMRDYINPSLDTTISATGQMIYQMGRSLDRWRRLQRSPELIDNAVNESVRLSGAVRSFSRRVTTPVEIGGVQLPAGARIMVLYGCANRDERQFENPDELDIDRRGMSHLGFGHGIHMCAGMHLASLEMRELLKAMISRVDRIETGEPVIALHNTIHKFKSLKARLHPLAKARSTVSARSASRADHRWLEAIITARHDVAVDIVALELAGADGHSLPPFTAGAHVDVQIASGVVRQYSLSNDPRESNRYRLAVLREDGGKGGSIAVHDRFFAGQTVQIGRPRNNFPLASSARRHVLFAGGIGITPLLSMAHHLKDSGRDFELHYCVRTASRAAFAEEIRLCLGSTAAIHCDDVPASRMDAERALRSMTADDHLYVCGPAGFMDHIRNLAAAVGIEKERIHFEYFGSEIDTTGDPFTVIAQRSGLTLQILPGQTILRVLEQNGVAVTKSCESGVCGSCITPVLAGIPDHRDMVLTDAEKALNDRMTVCCSRSKSRTIVIDL